MSYEDAKDVLENQYGFTVDEKYEVSDEEAGTVIGQSLDEGYKQDPTDKSRSITLTVSKGSYVILENYVGMKYEEAESKLKALGFNVTKREQSSDEDSGTVIDQNLCQWL